MESNIRRRELVTKYLLHFRLSSSRRALDAELRECCADGVANITKKENKEAMTAEEEKILWEKNLLDCHSAKSLLHTIYFYNWKLFGICEGASRSKIR